MLQQRAKMQWMKDEDQYSRIFFRKIAQKRVMRRILHINDENGNTHMDPGEVAHKFVSFFQNLLGGTKRRSIVDIRYLRPWARHCITDEEASHLLLPFSPDDVKQAVFDITKDKASGPDGYSLGFFKVAWPMVGEEITRAVLDFFSTRKLLKQINSTILALIPKMRLPPRCALKVDIRNAYDTVEWDFLLAVLQLFGFPPKFTSFTLGFLQRIKQDMQFTYHLKCESFKVFQLGFADGLLLFCRADFDSIRVFKEGLDWFAEVSGLWLNVQKSHLTISRLAQELKDQMLEILGFQEGHLPIRYLGLPLISSRLSISDCQPLISKIDARINGWEGISLSYAGRVQIIKSMLSAFSLYYASAFILPKKVINEIEKRLKNFLWKGHPPGFNGFTKAGYGTHQFGLSVNMEDPWHHLGPFIERFPQGPRHLRLEESAKLSSVISAGEWQWPTITDLEYLEITHNLPLILVGDDRVVWRCDEGQPTTQALYRLFDPSEPKVGWSLLLSGSLKIPRHSFILWLAIVGQLPTTDKSWLSHLGVSILCNEGATKSHSHLFFRCRFSRQCLFEIRRRIRFHWPNRDWATDIEWATRNGERILSADLASSVSTRALYRLWHLVGNVLLRFAQEFDFIGPIGTGQQTYSGQRENGGADTLSTSLTEHCSHHESTTHGGRGT
ncbi:UNVERIFIED_CONTAM: hypothetical protein Sindi_0720500 [Sesamum indicum]